MKKMKALIMVMVMLMIMPAEAARIIYVPHDGRPVCAKQTAAVLEAAGVEVLLPPEELLGDATDLGNADRLWEWLVDNTDKRVDAAVLSTDALIYGSLVGSRKHDMPFDILRLRAQRFQEYQKEHKRLPIYAFGSIMRTPRSGTASGHQEPEYYQSYGADIFRYTALIDKAETDGLTRRESKEREFLEELIPTVVLSDWMERRKKNFDINKILIDVARGGAFRYLLLGRDDNAPHCQTHLESRYLKKYGLGAEGQATIAGIDELGLLLLTRAMNEKLNRMPMINVKYNWGRGGATIPAYSDEPISESISDAVKATGGIEVPSPDRADIILMVNTNPDGKTLEGGTAANDGAPRDGTKYMADLTGEYVNAGYDVTVADIAFANGADNAFMSALRERGLLFRLKGYAGWNTATNSSGWALAMSELTALMPARAVDDLLITRYLDDWAYQGNVRGIVGRQLTWLRGDGWYGALGEKKGEVQARATALLERFAERELPPFAGSDYLTVEFPWSRMFEADIIRH